MSSHQEQGYIKFLGISFNPRNHVAVAKSNEAENETTSLYTNQNSHLFIHALKGRLASL